MLAYSISGQCIGELGMLAPPGSTMPLPIPLPQWKRGGKIPGSRTSILGCQVTGANIVGECSRAGLWIVHLSLNAHTCTIRAECAYLAYLPDTYMWCATVPVLDEGRVRSEGLAAVVAAAAAADLGSPVNDVAMGPSTSFGRS
ncbi:hypothetical protein CHU98_g1542 [Xylaria longipes]|nr:hypothetical protein CHU98_g1542 [Xylaria longipes]